MHWVMMSCGSEHRLRLCRESCLIETLVGLASLEKTLSNHKYLWRFTAQ